MKSLQISLKTARRLYPTAAPEFKKLLEETFDKDYLSQKVTDRIKTFEDACLELGIEQPFDFSITYNAEALGGDIKSIAAYAKLIIITRALNEGWEPDGSEYKYHPWFGMSSSAASGFSFHDCDYGHTHSHVAARLCFKSRELAEYAGKQFEDIYRDFMTF